tara:strand:+ start:267 stop:497 length:231 start_codon:yes stop_codon:yes gene_type:complete
MAITNEALLAHLAEEVRRARNAETMVYEHQRNGAKYTRVEDGKLISGVKALHPDCTICADWDGSSAPVPDPADLDA